MFDGSVYIEHEDDYPLGELPIGICAAVEEVKRITQAPLALIVASALASAATACQGLADVQRPTIPGAVPLSLFFVTVAESGERKSAADHFFFAPIAQFDRDRRAEFELNSRQFQADERVWRTKLKGIERSLTKATAMGEQTADLEDALRAHHEAAPKPPERLRIALSDITPTALCGELEINPCSAVLHSNEAADLMRGRTMGNLPLLNRLWDGQPVELDRRDKKRSALISGARLSISFAVQPDSFQAMSQGKEEHARHSGFLARTLLSFPTSTAGSREVCEWGNTSDLHRSLAAFQQRVRSLLERSFVHHSPGLARQILTFDDDARRLWVRFFNEVEAQLKPEVGTWHSVKDFAAKAAEHAARLAAVFEVFQNDKATEISAESISAAIKIVRWHLAQFDQHLGKGASELRIHQSAAALLKWLQNRANNPFGACHQYTRRDLLQLGPRAIRNAASLNLAIEVLRRDQKIVCEDTKRGSFVRLAVDISANFVDSRSDIFSNNVITGFSPTGNGFAGHRGLTFHDVNRVVQVSYLDK